MKTRITIGKDLVLLPQPEGFDNMSKKFVEQYNMTCKINNPLIPTFNQNNDNAVMGQEEYESRYFEMFRNCMNAVGIAIGGYKILSYDGEDYEYEELPH